MRQQLAPTGAPVASTPSKATPDDRRYLAVAHPTAPRPRALVAAAVRGPVKRAGLLQLLDGCLDFPLTYLVGPAGSGKTVALTQWRQRLVSRGLEVAWYTECEADEQPATLLSVLKQTVTQILESSGVERVIIIDAAHRTRNRCLEEWIVRLAARVSRRTRIVLATRLRPAPSVAKLHAGGAVRIIEPTELQFTADEVCELLQLPKASAEVEAVMGRTGGWPIAVEFYRIWRSRAPYAGVVPEEFGGQIQELTDYLSDEVTAGLDAELRRLLLELSLFHCVTSPFADVIGARDDSAGLLDTLWRTLPGLVHQSIAAGRPAYRFNPLLSEYSRRALEQNPALRSQIHRRAANWFSAHRRHADAIAHARATRDRDFLTAILASIRPVHTLDAAGAHESCAIVARLEMEEIAAYPMLRLLLAWTYFHSGYFADAVEQLAKLRECNGPASPARCGDARRLEAEILLLEQCLNLAMTGAQSPSDVHAAVVTIKSAAGHDPLIWAAGENLLISAYVQSGDLFAARATLSRLRAHRHSCCIPGRLGAGLCRHDLLVALAHGNLDGALELAVALESSLQNAPQDAHLQGLVKMARAAVVYERKLDEGAALAAQKGLEQLGPAATYFEHYALCFPIIADVAFRRRGLRGLKNTLDGLQNQLTALGVRSAHPVLLALRASYLIRAHELSEAAPLIESLSVGATSQSDSTIPWRQRDTILTTLARWCLATGDWRGAMLHAEALIEAGAGGDRLRTSIKGHILQALAHELAGNQAPAATVMAEALRLCIEQRYVCVVAEEADAMVPLLQQMVDDRQVERSVRRQAADTLRAISLANRDLRGLNERETQIVALMVEGGSNKVIGRKLGLSENTIKFHLKRIFYKFDVHNRRAAIALARRQPS